MGFPTKPLFAVLCLQDQTEILNQNQVKKKKKTMSQGEEVELPLYSTLHPFPKPFLFNRNFLKAPSFLLGFYGLD